MALSDRRPAHTLELLISISVTPIGRATIPAAQSEQALRLSPPSQFEWTTGPFYTKKENRVMLHKRIILLVCAIVICAGTQVALAQEPSTPQKSANVLPREDETNLD